jgi:hypothetical protein
MAKGTPIGTKAAMVAPETDYRAQSDARTMGDATDIMSQPDRHARAMKAAPAGFQARHDAMMLGHSNLIRADKGRHSAAKAYAAKQMAGLKGVAEGSPGEEKGESKATERAEKKAGVD